MKDSYLKNIYIFTNQPILKIFKCMIFNHCKDDKEISDNYHDNDEKADDKKNDGLNIGICLMRNKFMDFWFSHDLILQ